jgi:competence protein ComEA
VGDAIAAAGGYSPQVDVAAAALQLNLAQRLADGDKIQVPARGDTSREPPAAAATAQPPGSPATVDSSSGTLINLNSATEAQLDTLPGIGPVTAGKIIAAREETPFASVDELLGRKVVGPSTFEKLLELVTVGP